MDNRRSQRPSEAAAYPDHAFPLASDAIRGSHALFQRATDMSPEQVHQLYKRMTTTNHLISDFGKAEQPLIYDAAMLGPIADKLTSKVYRRAAQVALNQYFTNSGTSEEEKSYVAGLLADRSVIRSTWREKARHMYEPAIAAYHNRPERFGDTPIDHRVWLARPLGSRALEILGLRTERGVNIESMLIYAAELLERLSRNPGNTAETLRDAQMANYMLAPFAEITGYDGAAMALQSNHFLLKNSYTGNEWANTQAKQIIDSMGSPDVYVRRTNTMLNELLGIHIGQQVLSHQAEHGIVITEGLSTPEGHRTKYRRKTDGSLSRKLNDSGGELPMDITGITLNASTPEQLAGVMARARDCIKNSSRFRFQPSPSRKHALHIKGSKDYVDAFQHYLGYNSSGAMAADVDVVNTKRPDDYQVAKITYLYQVPGQPYPTHNEIQFVTEADGVEARIGSTSHALHKLMGGEKAMTPEAVKARQAAIAAIKEIHGDRENVGSLEITKRSRPRAKRFRRSLAR